MNRSQSMRIGLQSEEDLMGQSGARVENDCEWEAGYKASDFIPAIPTYSCKPKKF